MAFMVVYTLFLSLPKKNLLIPPVSFWEKPLGITRKSLRPFARTPGNRRNRSAPRPINPPPPEGADGQTGPSKDLRIVSFPSKKSLKFLVSSSFLVGKPLAKTLVLIVKDVLLVALFKLKRGVF